MTCGCAVLAYVGLWQLFGNIPRTVAFEIERWENNSWGLHNIVRDQITGTVAVFSDGSRSNNIKVMHYKHYLIPSGDRAGHTIYLRPAHVGYLVDDKARTATLWRCGCSWEETPLALLDSECRAVAKEYLGDSTRMGSGVVAGASVIRYLAAEDTGEREAAFAPQFGCELFEERRTSYNWIGIPTWQFHFIVRSFVPGEPNQQALRPPAGYLIREIQR